MFHIGRMWHWLCKNIRTTSEAAVHMVSRVGPRNHVLHWRAHWRHLADMVEQLCMVTINGSAIRGGNAAFSQITLGNLVFSL